ncbi:MAG TPA: Holliday junction branch migration DNA helicase RuvB, partial [Candidatus Gracilibacteria bacterium]|nr:Holliday junction branch migration DNA helicase RuvB [Candidatus Gracilibacteria bacterium]
QEPLEHLLFYGPPGLGKTTLANVIANEMGVSIKTTSGPAINKTGDLAALLTSLKSGDILFIDEIHRLRTNMEEILYSAMEDYALDLIVGKGPGARSMRLKIPNFTLIGATTKIGSLSAPLRDRFGEIVKLEFYDKNEIGQIIRRSAQILNIEIEDSAIPRVAQSCRATPRIANRLLKRIRDFAEVEKLNKIGSELVESSLKALGVDQYGLDHTDRSLLRTLIDKFQGGPVGLSTIAAAISEEKETIESVYEPYLLQMGLLARTPRGRSVTKSAYEYFGLQDERTNGWF